MRRQQELAGMCAILALLVLQMPWPVRADTQTAPPRWTLDFFSLSPLLLLLVVIASEALLLRYMWCLRNQLSRALVNSPIDDEVLSPRFQRCSRRSVRSSRRAPGRALLMSCSWPAVAA